MLNVKMSNVRMSNIIEFNKTVVGLSSEYALKNAVEDEAVVRVREVFDLEALGKAQEKLKINDGSRVFIIDYM